MRSLGEVYGTGARDIRRVEFRKDRVMFQNIPNSRLRESDLLAAGN